jgi:ribonuclease HII
MALLSYYKEGVVEAGCDEAGRGCIAGPVVAASVILPQDYHNELLDDSKKLTEKKRDILRKEIEQEAIAYAVSFIDHEEIDRINILNASILGMQNAVDKLLIQPELLLIDGNKFKPFRVPHECFVKGDGRFLAIAAASVLAKTYRDEYMLALDTEYPVYKWSKNKGYPTKDHCEAIELYGYTNYHRKTFHVKSLHQTKLDL